MRPSLAHVLKKDPNLRLQQGVAQIILIWAGTERSTVTYTNQVQLTYFEGLPPLRISFIRNTKTTLKK